VDGTAIGTGKPGPIATRLRDVYLDEMRKQAL
jgi:D-alanine transaminase